ncbi:UNVERIFIED_CONTAM: hypothetical protein Scaly_2068500 [Sesamum calycinum]|uniref:Uncharacterized protein n=1 Tax=Sesamum calycinum TaxID=2727403 RepID=A0AAW2N2I2_9LAMI
MNSDGHGTNLSDLENKTTPSYLDDASTTGSSVTPNPALEGFVVGGPTNGHVKEEVVSQPKRAAKIYNFCLGILFGTKQLFLTSFGLLSCLSVKAIILVNLSSGVACWLYFLKKRCYFNHWCALWRCSSGPQHSYFEGLETRKIELPLHTRSSSAAMLCFYAHVVISRCNRLPKKFKTSTPVASS